MTAHLCTVDGIEPEEVIPIGDHWTFAEICNLLDAEILEQVETVDDRVMFVDQFGVDRHKQRNPIATLYAYGFGGQRMIVGDALMMGSTEECTVS
ncbi:MAG: hypothetical protein K9N51_03195 [Candidatus Pacebacteria bacterium]|nr:hypothetical protein [Candidatus Paceibacterota bacterium]